VTARPSPIVGDRLRFDGKSTSWLARAATKDGRYLLCTASLFGKVNYTIIDFEKDIRGPMNVIGWGLGIDSRSGPDPAIDQAIDRLQSDDGWEISHRNYVRLDITHRLVGTR
jgi:hypothetical protein